MIDRRQKTDSGTVLESVFLLSLLGTFHDGSIMDVESVLYFRNTAIIIIGEVFEKKIRENARKRWMLFLKVRQKFFNSLEGEGISANETFSILLPVIIDQFFLVSFNFMNTAMISSSGAAAISAVNMVGSINIFLVQVFVAIGLGGTVLISRTHGGGDHRQLGRLSGSVLHSTFLVGVLLMILFLVLHQFVLNLLFGQADATVMTNAKLYFIGILLSYPAHAIIEGINGSLRGLGFTQNSLKNSLFMNVIYIIGNLFFVIYLQLGIMGLIYSLLISRLSAVLFASYAFYLHRSDFRLKRSNIVTLDFSMIRYILTISLPFAAESFFFNGGKIIMQMMIVSLGTAHIAANAIAGSWIQLAEIIPSALATALVPIVGQSVGRKNINDVKKLTNSFIRLAIIAIITVDLLLLPLFPFAMKLFNPPTEMIPIIFRMYLVAFVMHGIAWCYSFVLPSALRAVGDGKFTTTVSLISMWLFRIGAGYLVGIQLGYGLVGIFVVMTIEWGIRGFIFYKRFSSNKWLENLE